MHVSALPVLDDRDLALVAALRRGLPLVSHPYAELGRRIGLSETDVLERLRAMIETGAIRRFGAIVRHHEVGYRANAMVVFDVPDARVREIGRRLPREEPVTLCYRRRRARPHWPYNLYCMIHGRDHAAVLEIVKALVDRHGLTDIPRQVLFSRRRFKQTAGHYGRHPQPVMDAGAPS